MEDFFLLTAKALLYPRTIRGFYNTRKPAVTCGLLLSVKNLCSRSDETGLALVGHFRTVLDEIDIECASLDVDDNV